MPKYKLVCFDVDGTLVDNVEYSWEIFHEYFRTDKNRRESAKNAFYSGKISYVEWAEHDINLWMEKGATKKEFLKAMEVARIKLMAGAEETIKELRQNNMKLAIISGTLNIILESTFPDYENFFDYIFLSRLYFGNDGKISKSIPTAFDMEHKATALKKIVKKENISLKECVFIGDHHNDVKIAQIAGLGIAFNCKSDKLRKIADIVIEKRDLREVLRYVLWD